MDTGRLKLMYDLHGLMRGQLESLTDLAMLHGVNAQDTAGFLELEYDDQEVFLKFLLNFYNSYGLRARAQLVPSKISVVSDERRYLRFDFIREFDDYSDKSWLHVISPTEFY